MNPPVVCFAYYTFYSGSVTVRESGKCSASVSHRSDSASVCAAQRQPELLLFHLDHSSLPRMRMLRLTGLSFSSSVSCSQALFLLLELRSSAHSRFVLPTPRPASLSLCIFFLSTAFLASLGCSVSSFSSTATSFLSILFISSLHKKKMEIKNGGRHSGIGPLFKSGCLVVQFRRCQCVECRVGRRSSRAAFIVEQPVWRTLPSEQQQQFGNESCLTLLLIQQGNVVGLLDSAFLGLFQ